MACTVSLLLRLALVYKAKSLYLGLEHDSDLGHTWACLERSVQLVFDAILHWPWRVPPVTHEHVRLAAFSGDRPKVDNGELFARLRRAGFAGLSCLGMWSASIAGGDDCCSCRLCCHRNCRGYGFRSRSWC